MRTMSKPKRIKDEGIDYSDIPKLTAAELKKFKKVGRAPVFGLSTPVSLNVDFFILEKLKRKAKKKGVKFQSLINEILKKAV